MNFFQRTGSFLYNLGSSNRYTKDKFNNRGINFQPDQPQWDEIEGCERELYNTTGLLQLVINRKAGLKASGRWEHYKVNQKGQHEHVVNSPYLKLLNDPNALLSGTQFLKEYDINMSVYGANFMRELRGFDSQPIPSALWNIPPHLIDIKTTGLIYAQTELDKIIEKFVYDRGGSGEAIFKANEIIYTKSFNIDHPVFPKTPFEPIQMEISNIRAAMGYQNVILRKMSALGILSNEAKDAVGSRALRPDEKKALDAAHSESYDMMDRNKSKLIISPISVKWQPMSYPAKELLLTESMDRDFRRIIDHYGLNEHLFSLDRTTALGGSGGDIIEGQKMALQSTIIPEADALSETMNKRFNLDTSKEYVKLCYDHLPSMQTDKVIEATSDKIKAETLAIFVQSGYSKDEAAIMAGVEL